MRNLLTTDAILLVHPQRRLSYTPWKIFNWRLTQSNENPRGEHGGGHGGDSQIMISFGISIKGSGSKSQSPLSLRSQRGSYDNTLHSTLSLRLILLKMNRSRLAHTTDVKGKGICYEDDDGPIQLTDQDDSPTIRDYRLSLIGKILNPKKQNVVKLIQTMPAQKIASPEGEEVSIQIHYDKLFKHCTTCRMLTHQKASCPMSLQAVNIQGDRTGVFARVQLPMNEVSRQSLLRDEKPFEKFDRSGRFDYGTTSRLSNLPTRKDSHADGFMKDVRVSHYRNDAQNYRHGREHSGYDDKYARRACGFDRKINNKAPHRNSRYAPKIKNHGELEQNETRDIGFVGRHESYAHHSNQTQIECSSNNTSDVLEHNVRQISGRKIASKIVTPTRDDQENNVTIRDRGLARTLSFSPKEKLLTADDQIIDALNDMEIIGTSNIEGDPYETAMVGEDHDDDLLGDALLDMEDSVMNDAEEMVDTGSREKADTTKTEKSKALSYKSGGFSGIPLGLQSKKAEFLRRGSPKLVQ
ncbi:hypothetical protein HID58_077548 [Brassica napus]|uniref:Zinc knuckle CX2CX4HX4C domain-containing protein n=1 Tax=Brassica napus TaxID=3708 RepID=A0ABQ7YQU4_BRANA|nr:hypothetical protein HID58_077548 [Brassica napus]